MTQPLAIGSPAQVVELKKTQVTMVVALFTVLFLLLNFIVNYVERATASEPKNDVISILNQQTAILSRMESMTTDSHNLLTARTIPISETSAAAKANSAALSSIAQLLSAQALVLQEQTKVLQKLSIWLDMQIKRGG